MNTFLNSRFFVDLFELRRHFIDLSESSRTGMVHLHPTIELLIVTRVDNESFTTCDWHFRRDVFSSIYSAQVPRRI